MLTKHPILDGKLVHAWTEPALRGDEPTRFGFVIDEMDTVLAPVTDKYRLVRNADLVSALDVAADERGIVLEPTLAAYRNGRAKYAFHAPNMAYKVGRDPSEMTPQVVLRNDYRGGGGLHVQSGYFRILCTNGLMRGTIAYSDNQRHVGKFNLAHFVGAALDRIREIFEADRLVAETMAATPIVARVELMEKMLADTAKRYHPDLVRAFHDNIGIIGHNAWAVMQAVSEVATHRMQERTHFNFAADAWVARMEALVRENAELVI